jgi:Flp pilus assembly protein TadD
VAEEALRLAEADPSHALVLAAAAAEAARAADDHDVGAMAERAWGLALHHRGDLDTALEHCHKAVRLGRRSHSSQVAAEARMTLAFVLVERGRSRQALQEIETALRLVGGVVGARARAQRGTILMELGRFEEAIEDFRTALPVLRDAGDLLWVCRTVSNRGLTYAYRHEFAAAETDLREAERLSGELSMSLAVAFGQANLAYVLGLRGDVCGALDYFDRAERGIRAHGAQVGTLLQDRSELLLAARLVSEARETAGQAIVEYEKERRGIKLPGVHLLLAQAAFLDEDPASAVVHARLAEREFRQQQRREWAALARLAVLRSEYAESRHLVRVDRVERVIDELAAAGWSASTVEARLLAAKLLLKRGRLTRARSHLRLARAARNRRAPAIERARAWYAEAVLRSSYGNARSTASAIQAGLRVLDGHQAVLGATDLRAHAAAHRGELVELGLRGALSEGRPRRVFEWAERGRGIHLLQRPLTPPDDPFLAEALSTLRGIVTEINASGGPGDDAEVAALVERQVGLERQIRDNARRRRGDAVTRLARPVRLDVLAAALRGLALVEFVQLDGDLHAVSIVDGRLRLHHLGSLEQVEGLLDRVVFALEQLNGHPGGSRTAEAAMSLLRHAAERLDLLLIRPLHEVGDRSMVIVPTGVLQSMPWSVLPGCIGRPVTIAPSATIWCQADGRPTAPGGHVAVAAGPTLPGARAEAQAVAALYRTGPLLHPFATVDAVMDAMNGAAILHLAAHGRLSAHNPLFSHMLLSDGPLSAYDLERLDAIPHTTILAACDTGRSVVCAGDELLGLSATFLGRGAAQLVASVMPILDTESATLMVALHRLIISGDAPAAALATVQQHMAGDVRTMTAAAGFVCMGAGFTAPVPSGRAPESALEAAGQPAGI